MKLKQLSIDNIASIEHAEINFDAAPLADEHLLDVYKRQHSTHQENV